MVDCTCQHPADGARPLDGGPPHGECNHFATVQHEEALEERRSPALARQTPRLRSVWRLLIGGNLLNHGADCQARNKGFAWFQGPKPLRQAII